MREMVEETINVYRASSFNGGYMVTPVMLCFFVLIIKQEKNEKLKNDFIIPCSILALVLLNPLVMHLLLQKEQISRVTRFYWIVPMEILIAYGIVWMLRAFKEKWKKVLFIVVVAAAIMLNGTTVENVYYQMPNWYKVPTAVIEVSKILEEDGGTGEKHVVTPLGLTIWVRQYDASLILPFYSSGGSACESHELWEVMSEEKTNLYKLCELANEWNADYIILTIENNNNEYLKQFGYYELARTNYDETNWYSCAADRTGQYIIYEHR